MRPSIRCASDLSSKVVRPRERQMQVAINSRSSFRMASLIAITALICLIPLQPNPFLTTVALAAFNSISALVLFLFVRPLGIIATLSASLFVLTLFMSNWGFSSPNPISQMSWLTFVPAIFLMVAWLAWPWCPRPIQ